MMVRFTGRSKHTIKIKDKQIGQGYKFFVLCWHGFTYDFLYHPRTKRIGGVSKLADHCLRSSAVIQLAKSLPYTTHQFDVYRDNYFSNIPMFKYLRDLGIGACWTPRPNSKLFPPSFTKKKTSLRHRPVWNILEGEVIDEVLSLIWMDNNYVLLLTTIHQVKGVEDYVCRVRRRQGASSTNARLVRLIFGDNPTKRILIPIVIHMYNLFMVESISLIKDGATGLPSYVSAGIGIHFSSGA
jgi:hypothetical protein